MVCLLRVRGWHSNTAPFCCHACAQKLKNLYAMLVRSIFIRHAFGSMWDVLMEISFSPMMSSYLTFLGSESLAKSSTAPDENYAREVMQLFSLGLWQLNMDGTQKLDLSGEPMPTYDNTHIASFSKAWTGFSLQPWRSNLESPGGPTSSNFIVRPPRASPQDVACCCEILCCAACSLTGTLECVASCAGPNVDQCEARPNLRRQPKLW